MVTRDPDGWMARLEFGHVMSLASCIWKHGQIEIYSPANSILLIMGIDGFLLMVF